LFSPLLWQQSFWLVIPTGGYVLDLPKIFILPENADSVAAARMPPPSIFRKISGFMTHNVPAVYDIWAAL
jgi:hypothetical protein